MTTKTETTRTTPNRTFKKPKKRETSTATTKTLKIAAT